MNLYAVMDVNAQEILDMLTSDTLEVVDAINTITTNKRAAEKQCRLWQKSLRNAPGMSEGIKMVKITILNNPDSDLED